MKKQNTVNGPSKTVPGLDASAFPTRSAVRHVPRRLWTDEMKVACELIELLRPPNMYPFFFQSRVGLIGVLALSRQSAHWEARDVLSSVALRGEQYEFAVVRRVDEQGGAHESL